VERTSGSTGEPVAFPRTTVSGLFWLAFTARDNLWHARDYTKPIAYVRARFEKLTRHPNWGLPMSALYRTGPALFAPSTAETRRIWDWIAKFEAATLLTHPNTLELLARFAEARDATLPLLSQVWTNGETLAPETRELAERALRVRVSDLYSSEEVGVVAIQCPESDLYHVMAEGLIVEVLDAAGRACGPGEIGRVVVTDLHNHATPIIRYELGDVAEVGGACPCGRGLPTLKRIYGRERNQMVLPDGRRVWPHLGTGRFRSVAPILQYQFIQHDIGRIEARFVTGSGAPLNAEQEGRMTRLLRDSLGSEFAIEFTYFSDEIPRAANGKFEQFICRVS
jgi:phenylacetate-CoA ligase